MSAEAIVYAALSGSSVVQAAVGVRVYPLVLPEGDAVPALVYETISSAQLLRSLLGSGNPALMRAVVRVTCIVAALDFANLGVLSTAVRSVATGYLGTVAGCEGVVVRFAAQSRDAYDESMTLAMRSVDLTVDFREVLDLPT